MSLEEIIKPKETIEELRQQMEGRWMERDLPPDDVASMADFLERMLEVAVQLIFQEKEIQIPNTDQRVPYTEATGRQTLWLFCEGMNYGLTKTWEMGTPDELKAQFLQNVAQYVFENAKQVVVSTFGQEDTPGFEIPEAEQVKMVTVTAESALLYFINEYEKTNGPIENVDRTDMLEGAESIPQADPEPEALPEATSQPASEPAPPMQAPTPQPKLQQQPVAPRNASPVINYDARDEKYAALALLLNTLPKSQQAKLKAHFNGEQQEKLSFYSTPENIEQRLNMHGVIRHLKQLKTQLKKHLNQPDDSTVQKRLKQMVNSLPQEHVLKLVKNERPNVKQYLKQLMAADDKARQQTVEAFLPFELSQSTQPEAPVNLPPKLEAAVYRYLHQKVS